MSASRINITSIILILLVALGGGSGYWLYKNIESYEEQNPNHFSAQALRDPYLAAEHFLRDLGAPIRRESLQAQLDNLPQGGSVVLTTPSNLLTEKQAAALQAWIQRGGHLVVEAGSDSESSPDPLLRQFGVHRKHDFFWPKNSAVDDDEQNEDDEEDEIGNPNRKKLSEQLRELNRQIASGALLDAAKDDDTDDLTKVVLADEAPLKIHFDPSYKLEHAVFNGDADDDEAAAPFYWAKYSNRVHFAQFEVGAGLLTVVSDLDFWSSREIGKYDHARALEQLVDITRDISLISDVDMPPLSTLIWRAAKELVMAIVVLLLIGVWFRARRFGPIADTQVQIRRALGEHIFASATYLWRNGKMNELLAVSRRSVEQHAALIFAGYTALESTQQAALLHSQTGIDANAIQRALFVEPSKDHTDFRDSVITLQKLLNRL